MKKLIGLHFFDCTDLHDKDYKFNHTIEVPDSFGIIIGSGITDQLCSDYEPVSVTLLFEKVEDETPRT